MTAARIEDPSAGYTAPERNPAAERETYALARDLFLQHGPAYSGALSGPYDKQAADGVRAAAAIAWDLAAAFVTEAQRRQPEAWAVLPPPTKEKP